MQVTVRVEVSIDLSVTVTVEGGGQYWLECEIRYHPTRIHGSPNKGLTQMGDLTHCVYSLLTMMVVW